MHFTQLFIEVNDPSFYFSDQEILRLPANQKNYTHLKTRRTFKGDRKECWDRVKQTELKLTMQRVITGKSCAETINLIHKERTLIVYKDSVPLDRN